MKFYLTKIIRYRVGKFISQGEKTLRYEYLNEGSIEEVVVRKGEHHMSERSEIVFMQVRLLRLASEEWHTTVQKVSRLFEKYEILKFIEDCYGIFHTEGDEAVFDEINVVLEHKGVDIRAEVN